MLRYMHVAIFGLFVATTPAAAQQFDETISSRMDEASNGFELGAYQSIGAVERLLQGFNRYGIGRGMQRFMGIRTGMLANQDPDLRNAETFRNLLIGFLDDLDVARATLEQTNPTDADAFVLDTSTLWIDINSNNSFDEGEEASRLLIQLLPRRQRNMTLPEGPIEIRFDAADHAWLLAYTHVLSASAEAILAFDPTETFADLLKANEALQNLPTIPNTFDVEETELRISELEAMQEDIDGRLEARKELRKPLEAERQTLRTTRSSTKDKDEKKTLQNKIRAIDEQLRTSEFLLGPINLERRFLRRQISSLKAKLPLPENEAIRNLARTQEPRQRFGDGIDALYAFIQSLRQAPDPARVQNMEGHLRAMLAHNRVFWTEVAKETDDDREWVPNHRQTGAFGLMIGEETTAAWQVLLTDFESVLDGHLLVTHPLLPADVGINIAAWFDEPSPIDLVGWLHGHDAIPYLARGPRLTRENWFEFQRLTQGNGMGFAFFLN